MKIGLISDTHMPLRYPALPESVFALLEGVDLLLHAGDVGELWVLDQLSQIAPIVAVHGNDETAEATAQLPYQQVVVAEGKRILLWHSHYPDRAEEMASRKIDKWQRILQRSAERGKAAGADIVVLGHLHVPFAKWVEGVLLINPGALAGGNFALRQTCQTVATLELDGDEPVVTHWNLMEPGRVHTPTIDWQAPFTAMLKHVNAPIVADGLTKQMVHTLIGLEHVWPLYLQMAHLCWAGQKAVIKLAELVEVIEGEGGIPAREREQARRILM